MADEITAMISINGVEMPYPSEYNPHYSTTDSENSGRSETWVMHREIVRADLRAVEATWKLQQPEMQRLLAATTPAKFRLKYYDILTGRFEEFDAYCQGTRSPKLLLWSNEPEQSWWQITLQFTEY